MNRLSYILIPAVLAFSLFVGVTASGAHDFAFGQMNLKRAHMVCEGFWCGLIPEMTCSVHCLTSGLGSSLSQPVAGFLPVSLLLLSFILVLATSSVQQFQGLRLPAGLSSGLAPPLEAIKKIVKRE